MASTLQSDFSSVPDLMKQTIEFSKIDGLTCQGLKVTPNNFRNSKSHHELFSGHIVGSSISHEILSEDEVLWNSEWVVHFLR